MPFMWTGSNMPAFWHVVTDVPVLTFWSYFSAACFVILCQTQLIRRAYDMKEMRPLKGLCLEGNEVVQWSTSWRKWGCSRAYIMKETRLFDGLVLKETRPLTGQCHEGNETAQWLTSWRKWGRSMACIWRETWPLGRLAFRGKHDLLEGQRLLYLVKRRALWTCILSF